MLKREMKKVKRFERKRRVRAKISGTSDCPRLSVFRSLRNISVQAIDDEAGKTLAQASLILIDKKAKNTVEGAALVGTKIATDLLQLKVKKVVFDRSGYRYHGKVKALAEAARTAGLIF
ncbi:MAG: 50S ribosomal protein L18 [Candidatus Moranbacteria bacterium]|nr:50S ribosomal protein L18 [Candidatus Moranbacteria bacterium]OIQ01562.1 MAG: 50S ribosomal protein L18 [Candidatus Moranbacteria bacterium CG2_30_41_165]PIP25774.1 MAG: 50S ribosomal protein L18 [Candidatus Moranbacteria bacterium CG23_combo_of_CG06-09_8_20_14_all_41_28]PIV86627.1 MAG: 50S ribosomal protein L18 [Candidatus Moranbacteria bacterium CG17_big_fil_post_rev_8_21_14_2_50_41_107]PIW94430.1 MAG: 50S ribosomal protein L18 [Candidatus Moranbacteria bacterium CG_4_8_14_3_um_filter_41_1